MVAVNTSVNIKMVWQYVPVGLVTCYKLTTRHAMTSMNVQQETTVVPITAAIIPGDTHVVVAMDLD